MTVPAVLQAHWFVLHASHERMDELPVPCCQTRTFSWEQAWPWPLPAAAGVCEELEHSKWHDSSRETTFHGSTPGKHSTVNPPCSREKQLSVSTARSESMAAHLISAIALQIEALREV